MNNPTWEIESFDVSARELSLALWVDQMLNNHRKGASSARVLIPNQHAQAFLGELVFLGYLDRQKIAYEWQGWIPTQYGDKCDFTVNGKLIDVKTRRSEMTYERKTGEFVVYLDDPEAGKGNQFRKPMDYYVFALWLPNLMRVQLLGWSTKDLFLNAPTYKFYAKGSTLPGGREANQNLHSCQVIDLMNIGTLAQNALSAEVTADQLEQAVEGVF